VGIRRVEIGLDGANGEREREEFDSRLLLVLLGSYAMAFGIDDRTFIRLASLSLFISVTMRRGR
jgi:hypothetical protein